MGHANIWNSHPKSYGPGSPGFAVTLMGSSGSMVSCVAGNAFAATPRKLASSSTVKDWIQLDVDWINTLDILLPSILGIVVKYVDIWSGGKAL